MYGIYANIWGILMVNVSIYTIHGSYGHGVTKAIPQNDRFMARVGPWGPPREHVWTPGFNRPKRRKEHERTQGNNRQPNNAQTSNKCPWNLKPIRILHGMFINSRVSCTSQHFFAHFWDDIPGDSFTAGTKKTASARVKCPDGTRPFWRDSRVASGTTTCLLSFTIGLLENGLV